MTTEEPSNSELAWRLDAIQRNVVELVGRPEYTARQESTERRFAELNRRVDDHEKGHREAHYNWRSLVYTGVIPAVIAMAAIVTQILIAHGGK